jgi:hypothetical protein
MSVTSRFALFVMLVTLGIAISGAAIAGPSASIEQVRNGPADATATPDPTWSTGNAGASNSHYLESHSIAYRTIMDELPTDGTVIELIIGYDVKRGGSYALDYLTHYQRLLPHVLFGHRDPEVFDPLDGVIGVDPTVTTAPIPVVTQSVVIDPDGAEPEPALPQPGTSMASLPEDERVMTLFGGTLLDVTYVQEADVALATKSAETQIRVRFIASSPKAVLSWGGHIASRWDWGFDADGAPRSAGGISGSSYHMRLIDWNLGNLGNQDLSMSTDAVYPVPRCAISNPGPFCAGSTNTHTAPSGMESYTWSLFDNTSGAVIVGDNTGLSVVVYAPGAGSYGMMLTTTASGFTKECYTTVTVNAPMLVDAGPDAIVCESDPQVQLSGAVSGGVASWSGGSGAFTPGTHDLNAVYTPSAAEIAAGGVTLTLTGTSFDGACPPVSDEMSIAIDALPIANAGPDQILCVSAPLVQLEGSVSGSVLGGVWSGGQGTFSPGITALDAIYTPTAAEIAAGGVALTLTTDDPDGPCSPVSDQVLINFSPAATADAGHDQIVCASDALVQLAGAIGGSAANGVWSGGEGRFKPNASALDATYMPTAAEIAAGQVTLALIASPASGPCPPASDEMTITIDPITIVDAGPDQTVCASSPEAQLAGSVSGAVPGGTWSGGDGTFHPSATALDATYVPTEAEIAAGSVTLVLTSAASTRPCPPASDEMTLFIDPAATVDAGPDQIVCADSPLIQLAGSVGAPATGGTWSGGAGSFSPNASALDATYTPTAQEISAGSVTLTLTTNDPSGPCPAVSDDVKLTYASPTVSVPARIVCTGIESVTLCANPDGGVAPYTYEWSTGATTECIEVFSPGSYHVKIVDALGCEASGSGSFGHRDCIGELAHTNVTCDTYMAGTGDALESWEINTVIKDNIITSIAPGVFFYYTKVSAPSENFTVDLIQTKSNPSFPFLPVLHNQVVLYDWDCNVLGDGYETAPGQASVDVKGAKVGEVFIIRAKYSLKELVGQYLDPANGVHYDFRTEIDGQIVDRDPDGLQIGAPAVTGIGDDPPLESEGPPILRPVPNPFRDGMRMAYAVSKPQEMVSIKVYDVAGRLVRTLAEGAKPAGRHMAEWNGRDEQGTAVRKGMYFVRVRIGDEIQQVRVTFLR